MVAVAIGGAAVLGAGAQAYGSSKASKAAKKGQDQAVAEQRRQYDQTRADYAPWRAAGESALARLTAEMSGSGPSTAFKATPGYEWRRDEGLKAVERSAAARGRLMSGAPWKALQDRGDNVASAEYGDWWNRNAGLAGIGQAATNATAQAGQGAANEISRAYQVGGNARASSYANAGSAVNQGLSGVMKAYQMGQGGAGGIAPNAYGVWNNGGGGIY